jgi:hypothetical protein
VYAQVICFVCNLFALNTSILLWIYAFFVVNLAKTIASLSSVSKSKCL